MILATAFFNSSNSTCASLSFVAFISRIVPGTAPPAAIHYYPCTSTTASRLRPLDPRAALHGREMDFLDGQAANASSARRPATATTARGCTHTHTLVIALAR